MPEPLTVRVPLVPDPALSPNTRVHWRAKHRCFQEAKRITQLVTSMAATDALERPGFADLFLIESRPLCLSYVVAWGKGRKRMDDTNIKASLKAYEDGVAAALGIDDRHFTVGAVEQIRDPDGIGYVEIMVEPTEERRIA